MTPEVLALLAQTEEGREILAREADFARIAVPKEYPHKGERGGMYRITAGNRKEYEPADVRAAREAASSGDPGSSPPPTAVSETGASGNAGWQKAGEGRYQATINGRTFTLRHNRKTRTRTDQSSRFVIIGRKPRHSTTRTWYEVYETLNDGNVVRHSGIGATPYSLAEAKGMAHRLAWSPPPQGAAPSTPLPPPETPPAPTDPPTSLALAIDHVRRLLASALSEATTPEKVEAAVRQYVSLPRPQLEKVAAAVGVHRKLPTKGEVVRAIVKRITDQKGTYARAEDASEKPRPAQPIADAAVSYARDFATYSSGTGYGQSGDAPPAPPGLTHTQAECVRRAAGCGLRAGTAQRQQDAARVTQEREYHTNTRSLGTIAGLPASAIDAAFREGYQVGYGTVRPG